MQRTADACTASGARVKIAVVDVTDVAAMTTWVSRADADAPIDLAYACAGIGDHQDRDAGRTPIIERISRITRDVYRVNVDGVHNTLLPLVEPMCARGSGQVGSVFGQGDVQCMQPVTRGVAVICQDARYASIACQSPPAILPLIAGQCSPHLHTPSFSIAHL